MSEHRIARFRSFLARGGYRGADMDVVRRVTGMAAFLTALVITALAPLSPPDGPVAPAVGWSILCVLVGGFVLLGLRLERTTEFKPDTALAVHYAGLAGVALVVWLSDGRESPYTSLFLIWMAVAGASHPPRRTLGIIAATAVLAVLPFFYDDWSSVFAGDMALRLVIWSALTLMACVWTTRVRMQRADLMQDEEQAKRQARLDPLTGLGNRRAFDERLDRAIDHARLQGEPLSVIVADLDDFKVINDSYGHLNGDELLRTAAAAMRGRGPRPRRVLPLGRRRVRRAAARRRAGRRGEGCRARLGEHRRVVHPARWRPADARVGHRRARAAHAGVGPARVGRPRPDDAQAQAPAHLRTLPGRAAGLRVELAPAYARGRGKRPPAPRRLRRHRPGPVRHSDPERVAAERRRGARLG